MRNNKHCLSFRSHNKVIFNLLESERIITYSIIRRVNMLHASPQNKLLRHNILFCDVSLLSLAGANLTEKIRKIKIVFTPTICKQTCHNGHCYNNCEKGDTTTLYSQSGHDHDPKSGFRICESSQMCDLLFSLLFSFGLEIIYRSRKETTFCETRPILLEIIGQSKLSFIVILLFFL